MAIALDGPQEETFRLVFDAWRSTEVVGAGGKMTDRTWSRYAQGVRSKLDGTPSQYELQAAGIVLAEGDMIFTLDRLRFMMDNRPENGNILWCTAVRDSSMHDAATNAAVAAELVGGAWTMRGNPQFLWGFVLEAIVIGARMPAPKDIRDFYAP